MFYEPLPTRSIYQVISSFRRTLKWRLIKNYNIFRFFLYLRNLSSSQDSTSIFFSGNSFQIQKAHASLFATLKPAVDLSCRWQSSCCPKYIKHLSKQLCTQEIRLLLFLMSGLVSPVHTRPPACTETSPGRSITGCTCTFWRKPFMGISTESRLVWEAFGDGLWVVFMQ